MSENATPETPTALIEPPVPPLPAVNTPPRKITRNDYGLINDGSVSYVFTPEGLVDWRKMINPKWLVPNKQSFERFGRPVPETIDGLEDKDLLILLGGIKELAKIRGYIEVRHIPFSPSSDYVISACSITWIPNYETENRVVTFTDIGDGSPFNTTNFGKNFLGPIAANRAFVRAVRNFLGINIVSQEEISPSSNNGEVAPTVAEDLLTQTMNQFNVPWERVKAKLIEEKFEGAEKFNSTADIPKFKQFELIERMKAKAAQLAASKK